jgi:glycosyltransferase involved in cell wall biosynthesis
MRKVLIIAPTFFPAPYVAAVRVSQFARYLPEFGWEPLVLCRDTGYAATAQELADSIHPAVRVEYLGPRTSQPKSAGPSSSSRGSLIRDTLASGLDLISVPDAQVWKWRAWRDQATAIARQWQPDVVLSSSPPHSIHVLGRRVAEAMGVPWVADFRDPYLIDYRYGPQGLRRLVAWRHQQSDRGMYRNAALVVHAIPLHGRWASRHYPLARHKIRILTNGFPPDLLDERFLASAERSPRLSIRASGVLGRGAMDLVQGILHELDKRGIEAEFRHVGKAAEQPASLPESLAGRVVFRGLVSHREAIREIAGADVLLKYDDSERAKVNGLSSKLFEYLATGRPIVSINPTRPDWQLLRHLPWCWSLRGTDHRAIIEAVEQAATSGARPSEEWLTTFRQRYSRRNQTGQLAQWMDELLRQKPSG